ncbi:MAG: nucleotidyltransferase domain-containing protein [Pseudomonadota bacterium]
MDFTELDGEQRRELINTQQTYSGWREAAQSFRHSHRGRMRWKTVNGRQYLYRVTPTSGGRTIEQSLGRRDDRTEQLQGDYQAARKRLQQRKSRLRDRLEKRAPVNRALGIGFMPRIAAKILRRLDDADLLGTKLIVVGTHSLYAYAARAGVVFDGALTATSDIDLLFDVRRRMSLAIAPDIQTRGILGLLHEVDKSFTHRRDSFRAENDGGYLVDLIRPFEKDEPSASVAGLADNDLTPVAILGLEWLMNAPRFEEIAVAEDGLPVWLSCVDPRVYAVYKQWLATKAEGREAIKRRRDGAQAKAVAHLATEYLRMPLQAKELTALPIELVKAAKLIA